MKSFYNKQNLIFNKKFMKFNLDNLVEEFEKLEKELANPEIFKDQKKLREVSKRKKQITEAVEIYKKYKKLNEILEDLDVFDQLMETKMYQHLLKSYIYKTYILLHKAFEQIDINNFKGIEIEKPLYIYGNEHDCEKMNIYVFE